MFGAGEILRKMGKKKIKRKSKKEKKNKGK